MAAQIEAGTMELTLRDIGGVDLAIAQYARAQNVSRDAARQAIVDNIRAAAKHAITANPGCRGRRRGDRALCRDPGADAGHQADPRGKVPAMQLVQLLQTDPLTALAQFRIEASTGCEAEQQAPIYPSSGDAADIGVLRQAKAHASSTPCPAD